MMTLISVAIVAFIITNIDDFVMLNLLYGGPYKKRHIVLGQFAGIAVLIALSIAGAMLSTAWIHNNSIVGLLGFMPIIMGIIVLRKKDGDGDDDPNKGELGWWQAVSVCSLTIGSGYDNLAVYIPLFASASIMDMGIMTSVFLVLTGIWCFGAYWFARGLHHVGKNHLGIDDITGKLGKAFPWVLILLGAYVLYINKSIPYLAEQIPTLFR